MLRVFNMFMSSREVIEAMPLFEATKNNNVIELNFGSRRARSRKLAGHSLSMNVFYLPDTDGHRKPNLTPEIAPFVELIIGNVIAMLFGMGYEAEAQHLQTCCLERAECGDSLTDIHTMTMAYTKNVDDRIYQCFMQPPQSVTRDSRS